MKILIAVDSFKGSLSSIDFNDIATPILKEKGHDVTSIPISDGGEGFLDVVKTYIKGEDVQALSYEPAGDMIQARYILDGRTAYIDLDAVVGMGVAKKLDGNVFRRRPDRRPTLCRNHGPGHRLLPPARKPPV